MCKYDENISPYLRRPLRSYWQAMQETRERNGERGGPDTAADSETHDARHSDLDNSE